MTEKQKEQTMKIMHNEKEYEFLPSELSEEAMAQFRRANQIGAAAVQLEQDLMEKRFLLNNYISFVVNELDAKESEIITVDDKAKK